MIPTGPFITYKALPFPLPKAEQLLLKSLSDDRYASRMLYGEDSPESSDAALAIDVATLQMRDRIGIETSRRSFLPIRGKQKS